MPRPTSPHLQIYRWNISSLTSILHRLTGVVLYFSLLTIAWYLVYYTYFVNPAESSETCDCPLNALLGHLFSLAAIGVVFALYYHLANGIRHLFWDLGKGFELKTARQNGYLVLLIALLLTVATIGAVMYLRFF
ncbi:MAG: succinate dehydrogenase, cytochrome b556 subunit [Alphaproteobacteria bacterium]|nr:succinate dehydrogenase, cytochrome b556 subunit [Alphaproteobacteria bacterium]